MNRRDFLKVSVPIATSPLWLPHVSRAQAVAPLPAAGADGWISLLNDRDLTGWYTMLQTSGRDVAQGKKMVLIEQEMLHVMGNEIGVEKAEPGYIATNQEFENVHIRVEYKWGVKAGTAWERPLRAGPRSQRMDRPWTGPQAGRSAARAYERPQDQGWEFRESR
jgi:Domain of Unknown Function (DUF1080)